MMKAHFFKCRHCGNVVMKFVDSGIVPHCCGSEMEELKPQMQESGREKHLPVASYAESDDVRATGETSGESPIRCTDMIVRVGSTPHPMTTEHYIEFIFLETLEGGQMVKIGPTGHPEARFCICNCTPVAAYAYCNIHGLWATPL